MCAKRVSLTQCPSEDVAKDPILVIHNRADVGPVLVALRRGSALTQEKMAKRAGISVRFLSALENNRKGCSLERLADILDAVGYELIVVPQTLVLEICSVKRRMDMLLPELENLIDHLLPKPPHEQGLR